MMLNKAQEELVKKREEFGNDLIQIGLDYDKDELREKFFKNVNVILFGIHPELLRDFISKVNHERFERDNNVTQFVRDFKYATINWKHAHVSGQHLMGLHAL